MSQKHMTVVVAVNNNHDGIHDTVSDELRHYWSQVQPRIIFTDETLLDNVEAAIGVLDYRVCIYRRDTLR